MKNRFGIYLLLFFTIILLLNISIISIRLRDLFKFFFEI
jgi:hypothetical protein